VGGGLSHPPQYPQKPQPNHKKPYKNTYLTHTKTRPNPTKNVRKTIKINFLGALPIITYIS
jgi:hypothetical protein